jgi:hypothetical protein
VSANRITQIIQGKRSISGDTALRLGHWFAALPFEHPKLAVTALIPEGHLAERLEKALAASGKVLEARKIGDRWEP